MTEFIDWPAELEKARKQDPAIVPHLEAIREAWRAIMQMPQPAHPKDDTDLYREIVNCRRQVMVRYAIGDLVKWRG